MRRPLIKAVSVVQATCVALLAMSFAACERTASNETRKKYLGWVKIDEASLRKLAKTRPTPQYPEQARAKGVSGVAVAAVFTKRDGRVKAVEVLEAPDPEIAASVKTAVMQWMFEPVQVTATKEDMEVHARLTFYFRIVDGKGIVLAPDEMKSAASPAAQQISPADQASVRRIDASELQRLTNFIVLDVREREKFQHQHRKGAINIPLDELTARAKTEISAEKHVVVDCAQDSASRCQMAGGVLRQLGHTRTALLH